MALASQRLNVGTYYRVEFDGITIGEFTPRRGRVLILEGVGGASSLFLAALPGNYDPSMRDTYTSRPPAPGGAFRRKGTQRWQPAEWPWLLEQPKGVYYARFEDLGDFRIELDPEE